MPWQTGEGDVCPMSGEKFDVGEQVVAVKYYGRVGQEERVFRIETLGECAVRTSMLRAHGLSLAPYNARER